MTSPPSLCGACLNSYSEKDSAVLFPHQLTLYANLAACVFGETRHPEKQVCIDNTIDDGTRSICSRDHQKTIARSQHKMNICESVWVKHLKDRGWSQVAHCDVCCGAGRLLGKLRILPSGECESSSAETLRKASTLMAAEVLCFKRANTVHDVASEFGGLFRVAKLPGNRVGISIRYCFAVWICMGSIAISGESVRGLPLSTVHATATLSERILLQKGVPKGTPNIWKGSKAAPHCARSKSSATSIRCALNAAGSSTSESNVYCNWAKRSSTRRCRACESSRLGTVEALASLKSGACHPRKLMGDLMVIESDGSTTLKILVRASRI